MDTEAEVKAQADMAAKKAEATAAELAARAREKLVGPSGAAAATLVGREERVEAEARAAALVQAARKQRE
eukprot:1252598-Pleurochrysis_carterae.AAC.2